MTKEEYWFWLCTSTDIFREDVKRILDIYKTPEAVFEADKEELFQRLLITEKQKIGLEESAKSRAFQDQLGRIKEDGIRFLYPESPDYPEKLKLIPDAPYSLYVKGRLPDPALPSVGMVGARACSEYGSAMAMRFSKAMGKNGVQVISGMALGIDGISAKGAMEGGGKTFAVLGCGVDVIYPAQNFSLYYEIVASGGGIISEYPIGTPAVAWQFPARNRIISGLSDRLLVFEAKKRSGTLITVRYALDQGKDVYALPGRLTDKTSESCNLMIADGAGILISPERLLSEIFKKDIREEQPAFPEINLEASVKLIYDLLDVTPSSVQNLAEKSGLPASKVSIILTELVLTDLAKEVSKNFYVKTLKI